MATMSVTKGAVSGVTLDGTCDVSAALPSGGTTGQVLAKASNDDGDVEWATASGGSGLTQPQVMARSFCKC